MNTSEKIELADLEPHNDVQGGAVTGQEYLPLTAAPPFLKVQPVTEDLTGL